CGIGIVAWIDQIADCLVLPGEKFVDARRANIARIGAAKPQIGEWRIIDTCLPGNDSAAGRIVSRSNRTIHIEKISKRLVVEQGNDDLAIGLFDADRSAKRLRVHSDETAVLRKRVRSRVNTVLAIFSTDGEAHWSCPSIK